MSDGAACVVCQKPIDNGGYPWWSPECPPCRVRLQSSGRRALARACPDLAVRDLNALVRDAPLDVLTQREAGRALVAWVGLQSDDDLSVLRNVGPVAIARIRAVIPRVAPREDWAEHGEMVSLAESVS